MSLVPWQQDKETGRNRRWASETIVCVQKEFGSKLVEEFQWHLHVHVTTLCTAAVKNSLLNYFGTSVSCTAALSVFLCSCMLARRSSWWFPPVSQNTIGNILPCCTGGNRKYQNKRGGKENLNVTLGSHQYQCFALILLRYQPDSACLSRKRDLHPTPTTKLKKTRRALLIGGWIKSNIDGDLRANNKTFSKMKHPINCMPTEAQTRAAEIMMAFYISNAS